MAKRIDITTSNPSRKQIAALHTGLGALRQPIAPAEVKRGHVGDTTLAAIRGVQERAGLPATGELTTPTVAALNRELEHAHVATDKTRTQKLQAQLVQLGAKIDPAELSARSFGASTTAALAAYQRAHDLGGAGTVTEAATAKLAADSLAKRLSTKTQVGQLQRKLLHVARIAKLEAPIDATELKAKALGPTTTALVRALQTKYKLPVTGTIDVATHARIESVAASRGTAVQKLAVRSPDALTTLRGNVALNATNATVGQAQQALAYMGFTVDRTEFATKTFGASTREAVLALQKRDGLPETGHVDTATRKAINAAVARANPAADTTATTSRLRGSIRNQVWAGRPGLRVQVVERALGGAGAVLGERTTGATGFYDVPYAPPLDPFTKQPKAAYDVTMRVLDATGKLLFSRDVFNPTQIAWQNFTAGGLPYRGASDFEAQTAAVRAAAGAVAIEALQETDARRDLSYVAKAAQLPIEDVMRVVLAHLAAKKLSDATVGPEIFYGFIRLSLPPSMPGDLVLATQKWTLIDQLVEIVVDGIAFMEPDPQAAAFDAAAKANFLPIATVRNRTAVLAALAAHRQAFVLQRPVLAGNGTLASIVASSAVGAARAPAVAAAFLAHRGMSDDFWADLAARPADFGGAPAVADLRATAQIGAVAKNHVPTLTFLKGAIGSAAHPTLRAVTDLAKLDHAGWVGLIQANGSTVPPETDGATPAAKIDTYAAACAQQAERMFPGVALTAKLAPGGAHGLTRIADVQKLVETTADASFTDANLDQLVRDRALAVDADVLQQAKVVQRVHRIARSAATAAPMLERKLHQSAQVVALGRARFVGELQAAGVAQREAYNVYGAAELQHANALALMTQYRAELYRDQPAAIVSYTYSQAEQAALLGSVPNLETLFGSADACDCSECQSLYGAAAYLTDVLRFLDTHAAETGGTVRDVLFARRPDLGNIKLSCTNTDTPVPYIDLACELLEGAIPPTLFGPGFGYQTTGDAAELRAFPANTRTAAYDVLRTAEWPMDTAFDLPTVEARMYLDLLGAPRHALMRTFQSAAPAPTDAAIAAEYFGISIAEATLATSSADATAARQNAIWGFDATRATVPLVDFLDRAAISYAQMLELIQVAWLDTGGGAIITIDRSAGACDLTKQTVVNLSVARFDRVHRFLRLWRRTGWPMWELDLLLRAPAVGNGALDGAALVKLRAFREVQRALGLATDAALALYQSIDTEVRMRPDDPAIAIPTLYGALFQNLALTRPLDPALALPLAGTGALADHKPALLAAFAIDEREFGKLSAGSPALTLDNLSKIYREVRLARGLALSIDQWLLLRGLSPDDPFASPQATLDYLANHATASATRTELAELDYLLEYRPDSPYGLRDETITGYTAALREAARGATAAELDGRIVGHVAQTFGLRDDQARALLEHLTLGTTVLAHLEAAIDTAAAPDPAAYRLLHKAATLVARLALANTDDLVWLLASGPSFGLLDWSALPVTAAAAAPLWPRWLALASWLAVKAKYPEPEGVSLRGIFDAAKGAAAPIADVQAQIATLTGWTDVAAIATGLGLRYTAATNDYLSAATWARLAACVDAIRRLGVAATVPFAWAARTSAGEAAVAQAVEAAAKSKYDYAAWIATATPVQDTLREAKRDALIRYSVERSQRTQPRTVTVAGKQWANPAYFVDARSLLAYYLIDVEMCSCQLTSRIKQAMSSAQMFVQRCFLNLEQPNVRVTTAEKADAVSLDSWRQWRTMKSYRVWQANRKVFLYPENWIEPELRDDKSPFFKDLESELLQTDLTADHAETAIRNYVEKLTEVAHLQVVGISHQHDDEDAADDLAPPVNVLHVVGRTAAQPAVYYYRSYDLNDTQWSAWEKIDADITGDHLVPVVYNRHLHLFWLTFLTKPQKVKKQPAAQPTTGPVNAPEAPLQMEIQLGWASRKDGGWTAKKISRQKLLHPWERPESSYHLKPRYKARENLLWLDIYASTTESFNNKAFYDPYTGGYTYVTQKRFDETARPWHASSFVFDGNVVDVKLKPLLGTYHMPKGDGTLDDKPRSATSLEYIRQVFPDIGRDLKPLTGPYEVAPRLLQPDGMHFETNHLANNTANPNPSQLSVLEQSASRAVLAGGIAPFSLVAALDEIQIDTTRWGATPFFYQDLQRAFFAVPKLETIQVSYNTVVARTRYEFSSFYHPYAALFRRELDREGVEGLVNRRMQTSPAGYYPANTFRFSTVYRPIAPHNAEPASELDTVDFSQRGAMSIYNWELFFHIPLLIATRLSTNQRFQEAMDCFHTIFDPTNIDSFDAPQRFWIARPFFEENADAYRTQRIENLLANLGTNLDQVRAWKNSPFDPQLIARYRPVAFQRAVVMKYIDNLIAWADSLFRGDTMELINEATTLYVLAYELLGRRPEVVPHVGVEELTYNELIARGDLDALGNESVTAAFESYAGPPTGAVSSSAGSEPLPILDVPYFCIPQNDKLGAYWDTIEDRLFKIRHCMNIAGVVRQLPLFEPPIDPGLLVKAAAAGVDLGSVLADTVPGAGPYKFRTLVAKAVELCNDVRALGERLRSVLELRDAEGLALLRAGNETSVLEAMRAVKKAQLDEAQANWDAVELGKLVVEGRRDYYQGREFVNAWEIGALALSGITALLELTAIAPGHAIAAGLRFIPGFTLGASGFGGTPVADVEVISGEKIAGAVGDGLAALQSVVSSIDKLAAMASTIGSYRRRQDEWDFQATQAAKELDQLAKQGIAAEIRHQIAETEVENLEAQIDESKSITDYMHSKFTNQELYGWMIGQIATTYFQSYQLAYELAQRAERAYQFELGRDDTFVQFGYWDSLKKGLLAGDRLTVDVRRMESAWLANNARTLELTKHVSLAQVAPLALLQLKQQGACTVTLPEWLYDLDFPGHYRRTIRSVSLTIPCVIGPYGSVSCTLDLVDNGIRKTDALGALYGDPLAPGADTRFGKATVATARIATSHGREDNGLFELRFDDERYLPFEGAGAASTWRLTMPRDTNAFDFDTVSDVILHVRYTALAGAPALEAAARANTAAILPAAGVRMLSLRSELSDAWHRFLFPLGAAPQTLEFTLGREHLPFYARGAANVQVTGVQLLIDSPETGPLDVALGLPGGAIGSPESITPDAAYGGAHHLIKAIAGVQPMLGNWQIRIKKSTDAAFDSLKPADIGNAWLVVMFKTS